MTTETDYQPLFRSGTWIARNLTSSFFGAQFQGRLDHKFTFRSLVCNLEAINSFDLMLQMTDTINHATA